MKKRILSCLVCLLLFATISSVAGTRDIDGEKGNERSFTPILSTFTFYGHWWVNPNGTGQEYYEKDGKITVTVNTMGLWKIIGIGTMNGTWSTSDELESGTLTGRFFYRMASFVYRGIHGLFIGTLTYGSDGVTEHIRGDFTAFGPENYGGSDWRTPSIAHGWAKGRSPKI
jgi:hypothetical protein